MIRRTFHLTCVLAVLYVVATTVSAGPFNRTTHFRFNKPIQVAGVVLPAGSYAFEIVNPMTAADVVRISDRKRTRLHVLALTRPVVRPATKGLEAMVVFREASPAAPAPIHAWYPAGVTTGYEFLK
jgi:hypothetical protein